MLLRNYLTAVLLAPGLLSFPFVMHRSATASAAERLRVSNEPGRLETFLLEMPKATVKKTPLGTLPSTANASILAVVATDPSSEKKIKGLEIDLKDEDREGVAYLDEEGLALFLHRLESLEESQRFVAEHPERYSLASLATPGIVGAINRSPHTGELFEVLQAGFYGHEKGFGVYLYIPPGKRHLTVQLKLPNADISQLRKLIEAGSTFLQAN